MTEKYSKAHNLVAEARAFIFPTIISVTLPFTVGK